MEFIKGHPAMMIGGNLVITDVHAGVELGRIRRPVKNADFHYRRMAEDLRALVERFKPCSLVVLGDLFHSVPLEKSGLRQARSVLVSDPRLARKLGEVERSRVEELFNGLKVKKVLVKSNHYNESAASEIGFAVVDHLFIEEGGKNFLLCHGHDLPHYKALDDADVVVMGHHHPRIDEVVGGVRRSGKAWVSGFFQRGSEKQREFIIMPAFSSMIGGTRVTHSYLESPRMWLFSPLLHEHKVIPESVTARLLDGSTLGLSRKKASLADEVNDLIERMTTRS